MRRLLRVALANSWAWIKVPQGVTAGAIFALVGASLGFVFGRSTGGTLLAVVVGLVACYAVYLLGVFGWHFARAPYRLLPKRLELLEAHAEAAVGWDAMVSQAQLGVMLFLHGPNDFPDFRCAVRDKHGDTRTLYVPRFIPYGYDGSRGRPLTHPNYPLEWPGAPLRGGRFEFVWTIAEGTEHPRVAWGWFKAVVRPVPNTEGLGL